MIRRSIEPGDFVIYRKTKHSTHPGRRAANIQPARHGETYSYTVDKYWTVLAVQPDGRLLVGTRRGKRLHVSANDPMLHRATWLERILYRSRFPVPIADVGQSSQPAEVS